jgi:DNA-directed RNA polymerase specialized sigma24 family protein
MSGKDKDTTMGGANDWFETTRWTQIEQAKTHDQQRRQASVNNLINRYWKPVYCCVRRKGYSNEDAKDMTQGFFFEIVFGRELIQQADQTKGRFRTFLLTALDRYVTSIYRKEAAKKRQPEHGLAQLADAGIPDTPISNLNLCPDQAFNYAWATNILDQVLAKIKKEYCGTGRSEYWEVFNAIVVAPIRDNIETPPLSELCEKYGIESEKKASNMIITVKRRFSTALKHQLRQFVHSDSEVEDEFRALIEILSKGGAA